MDGESVRRIYLIRHGQTEPNRQHIIQGSGLDASLNEVGQQQARDFYKAYRHIAFDKVFTSALKRTWESVSEFLETGLPQVIVPEFNEISWGVKDGTKIDASEQFEYYSLMEDWKAGLLDRAFEKGESPRQVANRLKRGIEILDQTKGNTFLLCMHGRAMRIFLCLLMNEPLERMEHFAHSNLCLYVLAKRGSRWEIELRNSTAHLLG